MDAFATAHDAASTIFRPAKSRLGDKDTLTGIAKRVKSGEVIPGPDL